MKSKERPEPEARFGVREDPPEKKTPYSTVWQTTRIWDGKQWQNIGERYNEIPTLALKKEVQMFLETGKQYTQAERTQKLQKMMVKKRNG